MTPPTPPNTTRLISLSAVGGALALVIVYTLNTWIVPDKPVPDPMIIALQTVITFGLQFLARKTAWFVQT